MALVSLLSVLKVACNGVVACELASSARLLSVFIGISSWVTTRLLPASLASSGAVLKWICGILARSAVSWLTAAFANLLSILGGGGGEKGNVAVLGPLPDWSYIVEFGQLLMSHEH